MTSIRVHAERTEYIFTIPLSPDAKLDNRKRRSCKDASVKFTHLHLNEMRFDSKAPKLVWRPLIIYKSRTRAACTCANVSFCMKNSICWKKNRINLHYSFFFALLRSFRFCFADSAIFFENVPRLFL